MRFRIQSSVAESAHYRPDIDGIRGIAVLAVVFFHAEVSGFSGGFVGVDIFFVISGYLITSILLKDIQSGRFSLLSFYDRRIRRIFPALFGVLLFVAIVGIFFLAPKDLQSFGKSMLAATLFGSNFLFARPSSHSAYFDTSTHKQLLLHTWSLSVEEQFYLLFPLTLFVLMRWAKSWAKLWLLLLCIGFFYLNLRMMHHHAVDAFYMSPPRAWELLIGSLLAMKVVPPLTTRWMRELIAAAGLVLMLCTMYLYTEGDVFPGIRAAFPCMGAWMCIYAGEHGASFAKKALSFRPLVFVGVISYSLYLWHWPILVFTRYFFAVSSTLSRTQSLGIIAMAFALAVLSFQFVERPFRGPRSSVSRKTVFRMGFAGSLVCGLLGFAFYISHGLPGRYDSGIKEIISENEAREEDFAEVCGNYKTDVRSLSDIRFCSFGDGSLKKVLFWGDSHVQQLYPIIARDYSSGLLEGHGALFAIENACVPFEHLNSESQGFHCDRFAAFAMQRAEAPDIDTVFIGFNARWSIDGRLCLSANWNCVRELTPKENSRFVMAELSSEIRELRSHGKRVIITVPFPLYDKSIPELEIRNAVFARFGLVLRAHDLVPSNIRDEIISTAERAGAEIFDPRASLCSTGPCVTERNGVSIYKDNNHIAASQIFILEDNLRETLRLNHHTRTVLQ